MATAPDVDHAWAVLSARESARMAIARQSHALGSGSASGSRYPAPEQLFYSAARSLRQRASNRYSNILAYDRTAVAVGASGRHAPGKEDEQYLNANVVVGERGRWWVASQAPIPETFYAFFRAIYTQSASRHPAVAAHFQTRRNAAILVQLTGWEEGGVSKADPYLPEPGVERSFDAPAGSGAPAMRVRNRSSKRIDALSSTYSHLALAAEPAAARGAPSAAGDDPAAALDVHHFYFDAWPDHGVPVGAAVGALGALVREVGRQGDELACEVWVHCSAGVGRTGTFIALSSLLLPPRARVPLPASPLGPLPADVAADPVAATIDAIREWRGWLVQNREQAELVYAMTAQ